MKTRDAAIADASAIARIYNEGIDDRVATFETRHRTADDVVQWLDGRHPVMVVEDDAGEPARPAALVAQGSATIFVKSFLPRRLLGR